MGKRNPRYGKDHDKQRRLWARRVQAGMVRCARCGDPILPGTPWHLDHAETGGYLGPSHADCNLRAAGKKRAAQLYGHDLRDRACWCGDPEGRDPRCPVSAAACMAGLACQRA
jgi:hypothetical protein